MQDMSSAPACEEPAPVGGAALLCVDACQPGAGRGSFVQHAGQDTARQHSHPKQPPDLARDGGVGSTSSGLIQQTLQPGIRPAQSPQLAPEDRIGPFQAKFLVFFSAVVLNRITFLGFSKSASGCHGAARQGWCQGPSHPQGTGPAPAQGIRVPPGYGVWLRGPMQRL